MKPISSRVVFTIAIWVGYALVLALIVWGMYALRGWTDSALANNKAQADWQHFRDDVADSVSTGGPVSRSVPQSEEPPALVLLRDYYIECLVISLVMSSALFWTFAFFLRGVFVS